MYITRMVEELQKTDEPWYKKMAAFLQQQAHRTNSRLLATLAMRVSDDPFVKVKKMIKDMVVKLMEEATEEAEADWKSLNYKDEIEVKIGGRKEWKCLKNYRK